MGGFYYVRNALNALASLPPGERPDVTVFVPGSFEGELLLSAGASDADWLRVVRIPDRVVSDLSRTDEMQAAVDAAAVDVVFPLLVVPPVLFSARTVGWIPDLQHGCLPDLFTAEERGRRDRLFAFLAAHCDRIACSSEAVRHDFERLVPGGEGKAVLLRFASLFSAAAYAEPPEATLAKLGVSGKYLYLPNQFWVHKNHRVVFEAWRRLRERGRRIPLVCTGWPDDYRAPGHYEGLVKFLATNGLVDDVRLLGFLERADQVQLFRGAAAVLQPSLFEGWSTSIEDAKSFGKRLIVSDIPVHREQVGPEALYFEPHGPDALAETVAAAWDALPEGHEPAREDAARAAAWVRGQEFGRRLAVMFEDLAARGRPTPPADGGAALRLLAWMSRRASALEVENVHLAAALTGEGREPAG